MLNLKSPHVDILNMFTINWIKPLYQPILDMQSGKIVSIEIFARLEHPEMGLLNQIYFIPILRDMNLLNLLYVEMLENTLLNIKNLDLDLDFNFSINAEYSIFKKDMSAITQDICNKHGFNPNKLTIDLINDGLLITPDIERNLSNMKNIGVKLMLNIYDFTINNMSIKFDYFKIDRRLISELINNSRTFHIIETLFNTSKSLGAKCVAEGVENEKTWSLLKDIGVQLAQGYYISKPIAIESLAKININSYNYLMNSNSENEKVLIYLKNKTKANELKNTLSSNLNNNLTFIMTSNNVDFYLHIKEEVFDYIITDETMVSYFRNGDGYIYKKVKKIIFLYDCLFDVDLNAEVENAIFIKNNNKYHVASAICEHLINFNDNIKLSHQEKIVIDYLMDGITNKQISVKMNLSEKTVSAYKKRALSKLNVKSIVELCNKKNHVK